MIWIYLTTKTVLEAKSIATRLVEERLVACANILGEIASVYEWKGEVREGREIAMVLKSTKERFDAVRKRVCELHSYACPCIVALPVVDAHLPFANWVHESVKGV